VSQPVFSFAEIVGGYGAGIVVDKLSGEVAQGEVLCILGRNGVGKSTLLKLLYGFLPCRSGQVIFQGKDITSLDPSTRRHLGMSYCPQERIVFENLSVLENLTLMNHGRSPDDFRLYFDRFPILEQRLSQHAGTLSGGERKILAFVRTMAEDQLFVILDEPTEGVQMENIEHMQVLIEQRKGGGTSFVVVEQNLYFAEMMADNYLVMDQGHVVLYAARDAVNREALLSHLRV
jgi:branched-chain amino acid transport system ATP-binding protein